MTAALVVRELRKTFGSAEVLRGISFDLAPGEVLSVIGASGSGKSTLLRCLNYLAAPTSGEIWLGETKLEPAGIRQIRRRIGMVFQQFNLWPHMTVLGNVIEALIQVKRMPRKEAADVGRRFLAKVNLLDKEGAYPAKLSGGQQQRVAVARALVLEPQVLLFDEPLSNLDAKLRRRVREDIRELQRKLNLTVGYVTHEIGFARDVADEIVFMRDGVVAESGPPSQVIDAPRQEATRAFLGRFTAGAGKHGG